MTIRHCGTALNRDSRDEEDDTSVPLDKHCIRGTRGDPKTPTLSTTSCFPNGPGLFGPGSSRGARRRLRAETRKQEPT